MQYCFQPSTRDFYSHNKCNFQQWKIEFPARLIAEAIPVNRCRNMRWIRVPSRAFRKRIPEAVPPPIILRHSISGISSEPRSGVESRRRRQRKALRRLSQIKTRWNDVCAIQSEIGIFANNEGKGKLYSQIKKDLSVNINDFRNFIPFLHWKKNSL